MVSEWSANSVIVYLTGSARGWLFIKVKLSNRSRVKLLRNSIYFVNKKEICFNFVS